MDPICGLIYDEYFEKHLTGPGHPENAKRATQVYQGLTQKLLESSVVLPPQPVDEKLLQLIHDPAYLKQAKEDIKLGKSNLSTR